VKTAGESCRSMNIVRGVAARQSLEVHEATQHGTEEGSRQKENR
jgi:hypothetical protein